MDALTAAAESALRSIPGIVSVYLFGSLAEGREHAESDADIAVLLDRSHHPDERARFEVRLMLGTRLTDLVGRRADVVILNDAPPQLARTIVTRGRRLVCTDAEADHAFVRDVQLLAADIEPFLQRMRALKLAASGGRR